MNQMKTTLYLIFFLMIRTICADSVSYLSPISDIASLNFEIDIEDLKSKTEIYMKKFKAEYKENNEAKTHQHSFKTETFDAIIEILEQFDEEFEDKIESIILKNPSIMTKLMFSYEHAFILGQVKKETEFIKGLVSQYITPSELERFIMKNMNIDDFKEILDSPKFFAQATFLHQKYEKEGKEMQINALNQLKRNELDEKKIQELVSAHRNDNMNKGASFSTFFNTKKESDRIEDPDTMSVYDYLNWAFMNGLKGIELSLDFLPFDPSKRLPEEISKEERDRIKELIKLYGLDVSVHSPLIGPFFKGGQIFFDPAHNVELYQDCIDFCKEIEAKSIVVHIADPDKTKNLADILMHAHDKENNVKVAFENTLHPKSNEYHTADEVIKCIEDIADIVAKKKPSALKNLATTFDAAHYNLVNSQEDPLVALIKIIDLAHKLEKIYGAHGFKADEFISEMHLNQNIGNIPYYAFFGPDSHFPMNENGPINVEALIQYATLMGQTPIIIAEQIKTIDQETLDLISKNYSPKNDYLFKAFINNLDQFIISSFDESIQTFINECSTEQKKAYLFLSQYFTKGKKASSDYLKEHLKKRAYQKIITGKGIPNEEILDYLNINFSTQTHSINDDHPVIMNKGQMGKHMFFIQEGKVDVFFESKSGVEETTVLSKGHFFGEMAVEKKDESDYITTRSATIKPRLNYVKLIKLSKNIYNDIKDTFLEFSLLTKRAYEKRKADNYPYVKQSIRIYILDKRNSKEASNKTINVEEINTRFGHLNLTDDNVYKLLLSMKDLLTEFPDQKKIFSINDPIHQRISLNSSKIRTSS